jgi:hypothetical protein
LLCRFLFARKVNLITEGLEPLYTKGLVNISNENAQAVIDFILNTKIEVNLSNNHKRNYNNVLTKLSKLYNKKKSFEQMNREDILLFHILNIILYYQNNNLTKHCIMIKYKHCHI